MHTNVCQYPRDGRVGHGATNSLMHTNVCQYPRDGRVGHGAQHPIDAFPHARGSEYHDWPLLTMAHTHTHTHIVSHCHSHTHRVTQALQHWERRLVVVMLHTHTRVPSGAQAVQPRHGCACNKMLVTHNYNCKREKERGSTARPHTHRHHTTPPSTLAHPHHTSTATAKNRTRFSRLTHLL
jgi:hypothetical protein